MINMIEGRPGGGKSYEAVRYHIIPAIEKGRKVITNIPLNIDHFVSVFGEHVRDLIKVVDTRFDDFGNMNRPFSKVADYEDEWRSDSGIAPLIVIDEAHIVVPQQGCDKALLEFYAMHRHFGYDILLLTQSNRKIHRDIRDMVQVLHKCSKNTAVGSSKSYTKIAHDGCGRSPQISNEIRKYEKAYFKFYQSHTSSNKAVNEAGANDVKAIWKKPVMWLPVVFLLLFVFMVFWLDPFDGFLSSPDKVDKPMELTPKTQTVESPKPIYRTPPPQKADTVKIHTRSELFQIDGIQAVYISAVNKKYVTQGGQRKVFRDLLFEVVVSDGSLWLDNTFLTNLKISVNVIDDCLMELRSGDVRHVVTCRPFKPNQDDSQIERFSQGLKEAV